MRSTLFAVLAVSLVVTSVRAQPRPAELERGFRPELAYQVNGVDTVSLFNGNLNLNIPFGSYSVSNDVSYSFSLRYSGNIWKYDWECPSGGPGEPNPPPCKPLWYPLTVIPMGWSLSFGSLDVAHSLYGEQLPPGGTLKYISPDGGEHLFYETLHDPKCSSTITTNCDPITSGVLYTRDGSYLRMKTAGSDRIIEFPNGQKHRFSWGTNVNVSLIYGASSSLDENGYPTTNWVRFEYPLNTSDLKITDSHGREHNIVFEPNGVKVYLAAAHGQVARYDLVYGAETRIPMPCVYDPSNRALMPVRFLERVDLPGNESWRFQYETSQTNCESPGTLRRVTLPTGGNINWTYQPYTVSQDGILAVGVKERCLRRDTNPCSATQNSAQQDEYSVYNLSADSSTRWVTVERYGRKTGGDWGLDSKSVNCFALNRWIATGGGLPIVSVANAGLPICFATDGTSEARNLSSEIFDCNPDTGACALERKQYLKYEMDAIAGCNLDYPCMRDRNTRVVSERSLFVTDGNRYVDANRSDFDGLGNYRTVKTLGFDGSAPMREAYTGFNLNTVNWSNWAGTSVGTYSLTATGGRAPGYTMLGATDSWMLGTFTTSFVRENGASEYTDACFSAATGFLHRLRLRSAAGGSSSTNDLLRVFTRDSGSGYASREEYFGGDLQSVAPAGSLCTLTPPSLDSSSYRIDHTYQYGALKTSQYSGMTWYAVENSSIDRNTGLVLGSRDTAGLATGYTWDLRGRLTQVSPPGAAATTYTYVALSTSPAAPARVEALTSFGTTRLEEQWEFDPFGRIDREKRLMPAGWVARKTTYNALGLRASISEWEADTNPTYSTKTEYLNYDAFGRVGQVKMPDASTTTYVHTGSRLVTRTGSGGGDTPISTSVAEEYDRHGRLTSVSEKSGPGDSVTTTTYSYDPASRLIRARMADSAGTVQNRIFNYDGRGFLRWESQPESGMRSFTYDARGHVRTMELGAAKSIFDLRNTFDAAERLTMVEARSAPGSEVYRTMKEFTYATDNVDMPAPEPDDYRKGKLQSAARYNYDPGTWIGESWMTLPVRVRETYSYRDNAGRRTHRTTTIATWFNVDWQEAKSISQSVAYDNLGQPVTMRYPMCEDCGTPPGYPPRDLTAIWSHGQPYSLSEVVPGSPPSSYTWISSSSYWPNGMRNVLLHGNAIADTQTVDSSGMPRPGSLKSETYSACKAAVITSQTLGAVKSSSQSTVPLTVAAAGTPVLSYQWYYASTSSPVEANGTSATYHAGPSTTTTYYVEITNACRTVRSKTIKVSVGDCVAPWIEAPMAIRNPDGSFTLSAAAFGTGTLTYTWRRLPDGLVVGSQASVTTAVLASTTSYQLTVESSCGSTLSPSVTASVGPIIFPLNVDRTAGNQLTLSWSAVSGAASYTVSLRAATGGLTTLAENVQSPWPHSNLAANSVFVYVVTAVNASGSVVGQSFATLGTTIPLSPVASGDVINFEVLNELLQAVNTVRAVAGWSPVTWSNILAPADPLPADGALVFGRHLMAIRLRLNEAIQAIGVPVLGYADPEPPGNLIRAQHFTEIQDRLR